jgi:hypothetical protein
MLVAGRDEHDGRDMVSAHEVCLRARKAIEPLPHGMLLNPGIYPKLLLAGPDGLVRKR